jgi:hypothetical protein
MALKGDPSLMEKLRQEAVDGGRTTLMLDAMNGVWTHGRPKVKPWRGETGVRYVQAKLDGWWLGFYQQDDPANGLCCFGRKLEARLEYSHLLGDRPWYKRLQRALLHRPHTSVMGEAYVPGGRGSDVTTGLHDPSSPLEFLAFAVPYWEGRLVESIDEARDLATHQLGLEWPVTVHYLDQTVEELTEYAKEWSERYGYCEGVVLKASHWPAIEDVTHAGSGRRQVRGGEGWYKVKPELTVDLVCTGVEVAQVGTEYAGLAASLMGSVVDADGELRQVARVPGLSVDERRQYVEASPVGRVFECRAQYVGSGGRLRHPRFTRWRDDKARDDCRGEELA